jgi:hypothetical protein
MGADDRSRMGTNAGRDAGPKALNRCCPVEETQRVAMHPSAPALFMASARQQSTKRTEALMRAEQDYPLPSHV